MWRGGGETINKMSSRALKYICGYTTLAVFNHFFATQCIYIIAQKFVEGNIEFMYTGKITI